MVSCWVKAQCNVVVLTTGEDQPKGEDATRLEEAEVWQHFTYGSCVGFSCTLHIGRFEQPWKTNYKVWTNFRAESCLCPVLMFLPLVVLLLSICKLVCRAVAPDHLFSGNWSLDWCFVFCVQWIIMTKWRPTPVPMLEDAFTQLSDSKSFNVALPWQMLVAGLSKISF